MLKKTIAVILASMLLLGVTLCFAAEDDVPRPKITNFTTNINIAV